MMALDFARVLDGATMNPGILIVRMADLADIRVRITAMMMQVGEMATERVPDPDGLLSEADVEAFDLAGVMAEDIAIAEDLQRLSDAYGHREVRLRREAARRREASAA